MRWDRIGLAVGGVACIVVTPFLALAYHPAFASPGEVPPDWADWIAWPTPVTGDPVSVYTTYGTVFGIALVLVTVCLLSLVRRSTAPHTDQRRAWSVVTTGLGAAAVGSVAEYGFELLPGFLLELLGFLVVVTGVVLLGVAVRREAGRSLWASALVAVSGLGAVSVGTALVGHLPSGPALLLVAACVVFSVVGLPVATPRPLGGG
jgi:hypothetical protein